MTYDEWYEYLRYYKDVKVYELGEEYDSWINPKKGKSKTNNHKRNLLTR